MYKFVHKIIKRENVIEKTYKPFLKRISLVKITSLIYRTVRIFDIK